MDNKLLPFVELENYKLFTNYLNAERGDVTVYAKKSFSLSPK